ncbi:hypothetical protein PV11_07240 [Exophiala sideris]|uniref:Uncharacterized protein n=1 Tax=Exophiala sideris TaxID=1016849 RepID=A0A0D1YXZ7_9EURO|nr:hypothetical protein PV11_07240 [Exophiala sideris]
MLNSVIQPKEGRGGTIELHVNFFVVASANYVGKPSTDMGENAGELLNYTASLRNLDQERILTIRVSYPDVDKRETFWTISTSLLSMEKTALMLHTIQLGQVALMSSTQSNTTLTSFIHNAARRNSRQVPIAASAVWIGTLHAPSSNVSSMTPTPRLSRLQMQVDDTFAAFLDDVEVEIVDNEYSA